MGAIYACRNDNNQNLIQIQGWEHSYKVGPTYIPFIALYCDVCKELKFISSKDIKSDGNAWRYT